MAAIEKKKQILGLVQQNNKYLMIEYEKKNVALADVAPIEYWSENQKRHRFNSQAGHMPGLRARYPVEGVLDITYQCISHALMFLSLSFSLPSPLSKNK